MKFSRNHLIFVLALVALVLLFRPVEEAFCLGTCTGWRNVSDAYHYKCPGSKPWRKVSRNSTQVNCCKCSGGGATRT